MSLSLHGLPRKGCCVRGWAGRLSLGVSPQLCVQPPLAQDVGVFRLLLNLSLLYGTTPLGQLKVNTFKCFFRLQQSILHNLVPAHILLGKTYLVTAEMFIDVGFHSINRGANRCTQELCDIDFITTHGGLFVL